jgi:hypothetical protein
MAIIKRINIVLYFIEEVNGFKENDKADNPGNKQNSSKHTVLI